MVLLQTIGLLWAAPGVLGAVYFVFRGSSVAH
jgi:hypothetical protein